jgi:ribosomal protein L7/L12
MADLLDLVLLDPGPRPIPIYEAIVRFTGMNIKQARKIAGSTPAEIITQVPPSQAEALKVQIEATGASIELRPAGEPGAPTDMLA